MSNYSDHKNIIYLFIYLKLINFYLFYIYINNSLFLVIDFFYRNVFIIDHFLKLLNLCGLNAVVHLAIVTDYLDIASVM